jgi:hypothetical protein
MKPNNERPAETAADSSTKAEVSSVSQHSSKPHVVCSQSPPMDKAVTFLKNSSTFQVLYEETKLCVLETCQVVVVQ